MPGLTTDRAPREVELKCKWQLDAGDYVSAAEISIEQELCVIGTGDGSVIAVEEGTGQQRFRIRAHQGSVLGISMSPQGTHFATCGQDSSARLWTMQGQPVRELPGGKAGWVEQVAWAPFGDRIATAAGRVVRLWNSEGDPLLETEALGSTVTALAFRADGSAVAAACYGGVHVWPFVPNAKPRHLAWKGSLISLAWSPDGKVIACGSQDGSVHFWRLANGRDSEMSGYPVKPKALAWDRESRLLATGGGPTVTVWDFRGNGPEGTRPIELEGHQGVCTRLAFDAKQGVLASGAQDTSVLLWKPRRSTRPIRYAFMQAALTCLTWHPGNGRLMGGDASGAVAYWEPS